jgi:hypothetical protein
MPDPDRTPRRMALAGVYLATPAFLLLDWAADLNLRTAFLEDRPGWKWAYYALLTGLGIAMALLPYLARPLATVEAGINALLTALSVFLPYVEMANAAAAGKEFDFPQFPILALFTSAFVLAIAQAPYPGCGSVEPD